MMCSHLVQQSSGTVPGKGIKNNCCKWNDIKPDVLPHIPFAAEHLSCKKVKSNYKPHPGNQKLERDKWHGTGNTGNNNPGNVEINCEGNRMP